MEEALVFYTAPLVGHLSPIIELCRLILTHKPSLSIHIFLTTTPHFNTSTISSTINPSITFHNLPTLTTLSSTLNNDPLILLLENIRLNTQNLQNALLSISKTQTIKALILDMFCFDALTIATKMNLPAYCFFTGSGSGLALFLHIPTIHNTTNKSLKELNTCIDNIPGLPPVPSKDMPEPMLERGSQIYEIFLQSSLLMPKLEGVIVNTFEALEPRSLKAISDGLCIPNGPTPLVYCVGPLVASDKETKTELECLSWLNLQPSKSVVLLCFGSMGVFSSEQLCEMASGLERSGQRFMWVVRNPTREQSEKQNQDMFCLDSLLPEGFLEKTRDRGLVVKDWAPQVAILNHDSVGGFVTHCGWNSVLEAVSAGVPMVAWPLYAEQRFNRVVIVKEMGVALWMHESESGFVAANEVEERVRELMESEKGELVRERVMAAKDKAKAALLTEGGSSTVALTKLVQSWDS